MPIAVKDYTWRETEAEVHVVLPLKGVKASKADILSTQRYIKVNYPPYLFEAYLHAEVVEEHCTARVGNGVIEFRLLKKDAGLWGRLLAPEAAEDRRVLAEKRAEAVEAVRKATEQQAEARAKKKREEERFAVREQMKLEQEERERIEREKQEERDRADRELQRWREEKKSKEAQQKKKDMSTAKAQQLKKATTPDKVSAAIWATESSKEVRKPPPPPRTRGSIEVRFTPRVFPTAARESKVAEEQEWLTKQAAARRISRGQGEEDLNERNPEFLKDRGVKFFKAKNYEAAVNVFSEAISLNPSLPQLYSNRAASYLALGEMEKCTSDCCRALELYYPVVPSNHTARAKVFARRGSAYAQSDRLQLAVQDYEAAGKLLPGDEQLKNDLSRLKQALEESDKL